MSNGHETWKAVGVAVFLTGFAELYLQDFAQVQPGYYENILLALRTAPGGVSMFMTSAASTYAALKAHSGK